MTKILPIALLFALPAFAAWPNGYSYKATATVQTGKVPSAQTNFTWVIDVTQADLKTVANAGKVQNASSMACPTITITCPADLIFTSDSAGSTLINWEVEVYDPSAGHLIAWGKSASISVGTVVYIWYGKVSVVTFQGGSTGSAWDGNYKSVWHLGNGSSLNASDYTSNALNLTVTGAVTATTGKIDGAANAFSAAPNVLTHSPNAAYDSSDWTVEAWWYRTGPPSTYGNTIASNAPTSATAGHWYFYGTAANVLSIDIPYVAGNVATGATTVPLNAWSHVVATKSGTTYTVYLNGTADGSGVNASAPTTGGYLYVGGFTSGAGPYLAGSLDEVRVSNIARLPDWIATEYNNQSSPSTFWAFSWGGLAGNHQPILSGQGPIIFPDGSSPAPQIGTNAGSVYLVPSGAGQVVISGSPAAVHGGKLLVTGTGIMEHRIESTTTGSTNAADILVSRGDQANGYAMVQWFTGASHDWNMWTTAGTTDLTIQPYSGGILQVASDLNTTGAFKMGGVRITAAHLVGSSASFVGATTTQSANLTLFGSMAPAGEYRVVGYLSFPAFSGTLTITVSYTDRRAARTTTVITFANPTANYFPFQVPLETNGTAQIVITATVTGSVTYDLDASLERLM